MIVALCARGRILIKERKRDEFLVSGWRVEVYNLQEAVLSAAILR